MAAIDVRLLIEDLDPQSGAIARRLVGDVVSASCTYKLGALEDIAWSGTGDVVEAIAPGTALTGPRKIGISLDGGATIAARTFSVRPQVTDDTPLTLGESGTGSASVLGTAPVWRQSAQQITLADALYGQKGTVQTQSGGLPLPTPTLPRFEGIGRAQLGLGGVGDNFYRYAIKCGAVGTQLLDVDANRDYVLHALDEILAMLPAEVDPSDAQYVIDSSDAGVLGGSQTIAVGNKGGNPGVSFSDAADAAAPVLLGSSYEGGTTTAIDVADFNGGDTHHGAPEGGKITDIVTVGAANGLDNAQDTAVLAYYVDSQHGGVYIWQGAGRLLQLGQSIGVHGICFEHSQQQLFIATDTGVYERPAALAAGDLWKPRGSMHRRCVKVGVDLALVGDAGGGAPLPVVYALASGNQAGQNGILRYEGGTGSGLVGGWKLIYPNDHLTDFAPMGGVVYCLADDNRTNVIRVDAAQPGAPKFLPVPGGAAAIGLDPLYTILTGTGGALVRATGIVLRTSLGSAGMCLISGDGSAMPPLSGAGMDIDGQAVQVNRVSYHNPHGSDYTINGGKPCRLLAATNRGLFICGALGGQWEAVGGQNNLGDLNLLYVASDSPYTPGQGEEPCWPVYAANESSLYVSYDGALHWVDVFSKPLDGGPAFYDLYLAKNTVFPPAAFAEIGYGGWSIFRRLDGLAHWTYSAVNIAGTSPGGAARLDQVSQISTPSGVPEGASSRQLLDLDGRFLGLASTTRTIVTIESVTTDADSPLLRLRPTHRVPVDATLEQCAAGHGTQQFVSISGDYYVIQHGWRIDGTTAPGRVYTTTTLSDVLRADGQDPAKESADSLYAISRTQTHRTSGRR